MTTYGATFFFNSFDILAEVEHGKNLFLWKIL